MFNEQIANETRISALLDRRLNTMRVEFFQLKCHWTRFLEEDASAQTHSPANQ